jgi:two-component system chemotaxis response regulator CheB
MTEARRLRVVVTEVPGDRVLRDALATDRSTEIAGVARDSANMLAMARALRPDVIVIDVDAVCVDVGEMTRCIMSEIPTPIVVVTGDVTEGPTSVVQALDAGALAVMQKPSRVGSLRFAAESAALVQSLRRMADVKLVRRYTRNSVERPANAHTENRPQIIAIAASTGGPEALHHIFAGLTSAINVPIVVTQHMAAGFIADLVRWLDTAGPLRVKIADDREALFPGRIYVAGDGRHLVVAGDRTVRLTTDPPVNGHRPSATELFRSVAEVYRSRALGVVLTGMGSDGIPGIATIARAGGTVLAQDEASSTVFGMPKAAIDAGIVTKILPLDAIAQHLTRITASSPYRRPDVQNIDR